MSFLVLPLDRFFYITYDFNNSMCYFLCKLSSSLLTPHVKEYLYISHEPMLLFLCHCWHFHCVYGRYWNPSVSKWVLPYRSNKKAIWLAKCRGEKDRQKLHVASESVKGDVNNSCYIYSCITCKSINYHLTYICIYQMRSLLSVTWNCKSTVYTYMYIHMFPLPCLSSSSSSPPPLFFLPSRLLSPSPYLWPSISPPCSFPLVTIVVQSFFLRSWKLPLRCRLCLHQTADRPASLLMR